MTTNTISPTHYYACVYTGVLITGTHCTECGRLDCADLDNILELNCECAACSA